AKELGLDLKDLIANKNTSAITVVNRTKHPLLFMREADRESGAFITPPPDQIAPGETGTFMSGESQSSVFGLTGGDAKVVWAVGQPGPCQWTIHWDNPEKGANKADQHLVYPSGQSRPDGTRIEFWGVEEFAQAGSTLSPFQFVIREEGFGGGAD